MLQTPTIGTVGRAEFRVGSTHSIEFADQQMPAVLATPWLVHFLEHAARQALASNLDAGESCVGVHIDIDHLAPTPLGQLVVCQARVIQVDKNLISFQLEAADESERIARGYHKRRVIQIERFARHVAGKNSG
jgi:predicted thioesterase